MCSEHVSQKSTNWASYEECTKKTLDIWTLQSAACSDTSQLWHEKVNRISWFNAGDNERWNLYLTLNFQWWRDLSLECTSGKQNTRMKELRMKEISLRWMSSVLSKDNVYGPFFPDGNTVTEQTCPSICLNSGSSYYCKKTQMRLFYNMIEPWPIGTRWFELFACKSAPMMDWSEGGPRSCSLSLACKISISH